MLCLRRAALIAMIPLIVVALATSCSEDPTKGTTTPDGGATPGQLAGGVCPDAAPDAGDDCVLPEGTTCAFAACGAGIAQCTRGSWRYGGNPPPSEDADTICPKDFPANGPCPCFPATVACRYGTCEGADATANVSSWTCDGGNWWSSIVETCPVRDSGAPDGAPSDAGADVQHDADADVD